VLNVHQAQTDVHKAQIPAVNSYPVTQNYAQPPPQNVRTNSPNAIVNVVKWRKEFICKGCGHKFEKNKEKKVPKTPPQPTDDCPDCHMPVIWK